MHIPLLHQYFSRGWAGSPMGALSWGKKSRQCGRGSTRLCHVTGACMRPPSWLRAAGTHSPLLCLRVAHLRLVQEKPKPEGSDKFKRNLTLKGVTSEVPFGRSGSSLWAVFLPPKDLSAAAEVALCNHCWITEISLSPSAVLPLWDEEPGYPSGHENKKTWKRMERK